MNTWVNSSIWLNCPHPGYEVSIKNALTSLLIGALCWQLWLLTVVADPSLSKYRSRNINLRDKNLQSLTPSHRTSLFCGPEHKKALEEKAGPRPWSCILAELLNLRSFGPSAASLWSIVEHILKHSVLEICKIYEVVVFLPQAGN